MSWEGFTLFGLVLFGVPIAVFAGVLMLAAMLIGGIVASVCAVPVGVAWALAAALRPQIVTGRKSRCPTALGPIPPATPRPE